MGVVLGSCLTEEPVLRVEPAALVAFVPLSRPSLTGPGAVAWSGDGPAVGVVGEAEVDEPLEVDGGGAVGEPDAVGGDASVGDTAAGADEPGEAAFDHGPEPLVVGGEVVVSPGASGFDEFGVVGV